VFFVLLATLGSTIGVAAALAGEPESKLPTSPSFAETVSAIDSAAEPEVTNPTAVEGEELHQLGRSEAADVLTEVFQAEVENPAGIFDELEPKKFLADNVAVIGPSDQAELPGEAPLDSYHGATLLQSSIPLRTTGPDGPEAVDLGLERTEGELRSTNPLVEVSLPTALGEGVELPELSIGITLPEAAAHVAPTIVDESVAFYPNVGADTDLAIAPSPQGFETLTELRSDDAPDSEVYTLDLPSGSELKSAGDGATVEEAGKVLLGIVPPTAIDANGTPVPASMSVSGDSITVTADPGPDAVYPVLVDPVFKSYEWMAKNTVEGISGCCGGWHPDTYNRQEHGKSVTVTPLGGTSGWGTSADMSQLQPAVPYGSRGLELYNLTNATAGGENFFVYTVPRYDEDPYVYAGKEPESFITRLTVSDMAWIAQSEALNPYVYLGIWGPVSGWGAEIYAHEGLEGHSVTNLPWVYNITNPQGAPDRKTARIGMLSTQNVNRAWAWLYVGAATVELGEPAAVHPEITEVDATDGWVNGTTVPVSVRAADLGLGVLSVSASEEGGAMNSWKAGLSCTGVSEQACPAEFKSQINVASASLPTGIDRLKVLAEDPLGRVSTTTKEGVPTDSHVLLYVDHQAPTVSLSGMLTEQALFGTKRAAYPLRVVAGDGDATVHQSGVAKTTIKVDGTVVDETSPGCATENCAITREWTLDPNNFTVGTHTVEVTATDGVGLSTTKSLNIELHPAPPPTLSVSGTLTEQGTVGPARPHYTLKFNAVSQSGLDTVVAPNYPTFFGSAGTATGQFAHPADIAVDPRGNLYVSDVENGRVEKFTSKGEYLAAIGTKGGGAGQLQAPTGVAIDGKGDLWVADPSLGRVSEFGPTGAFIRNVSDPAHLLQPEGLAVDGHGNVWIADHYYNRVVEYSETGTFVKVVGAGQILQPDDVAIGPNGNVFVSDYTGNRIEEFNEGGTFVRQFGSAGSGFGQLLHPNGIAVSGGEVFVDNSENGRVEIFNEQGAYLGRSTSGYFSNGGPRGGGIAIDSGGDIRVADYLGNRVEDWRRMMQPSYIGSAGTGGTGNGQFSHAAAVAVDPKGNIWAADNGTSNRIEEFNEKGEFVAKFGSSGSGNGQFVTPSALAIDSKGNIWVADTGNNRVQEFNEKGEFTRVVGSKGTGNGQFASPEGIAFDSKGNVWVADRGNKRIEEFSETGTFIRAVTSAALVEPAAVSIGPSDNVWVADRGGSRLVEFGPTGTQLRTVGTEGTGNGQFSHPGAILADAEGNVWVLDTGNNRVEEFLESGIYLGQFGSKGSSAGQLNLANPVGLARDPKGFLWTTNAGTPALEKWSPFGPRSGVTVAASIDGTRIESSELGCTAETCTVTPPEWILQSTAYAQGSHSLLVRAVDGYGRSTQTTIPFEIQPDTTKPTIEASGSLFEAPKGWVEQEAYEVTGKAQDAGSGVTQMKLLIDGTQAGVTTQTCAEGGCAMSHSFTVDTAGYPGGSHEAELVATDAAGNSQVKKWTINVDPEGKVSVAEVAATVEASDETAEADVLAPPSETLEPGQIAAGDNPGLKVEGSTIESTGVPDVTTMTTAPEAGFTIESPEGTTTITPVVAPTSSSTTVSEGVAGVAANTSREADSLIRPEYNGVQTFQDIRSAESPERYSWTVHVGAHQHLHLVNSTQAEVSYEDGTTAFLITAQGAHDPTGKAVPTSLEVEGNILTLRVEIHSASFVYPILAGAGWETSYGVPVIIEGPEDETQIHEREARERQEREEREQREQEGREATDDGPPPPPPAAKYFSQAEGERMLRLRHLESTVPAPEAVAPPPGAAVASSVKVKTVKPYQVCQVDHCSIWWVEIKNPSYYYAKSRRGVLAAEWEGNTQVHCKSWYNFIYIPELEDEVNTCGFVGPNYVQSGEGKHLTIYGRYTVKAGIFLADLDVYVLSETPALQIWVWPNGFQEQKVKHWDSGISEA
jgi:DNA-binding beta-propeller fold protein YncE